jgi:trk system potassium uptake protein TrkH
MAFHLKKGGLKKLFLGHPARTALGSFAAAIFIGAVLLCLPVSSAEGIWTHPVDALFTSTSAVCVTGLIVKDTPVYWSTFGELVILVLIQVGGLGIMTVGAFLVIILRNRLSLGFRSVMMDVQNIEDENIWPLIRSICIFTFIAELTGTVLLYFGWRGDFENTTNAVYVSAFHSISAFCNAGFSLYSNSLEDYVGSPVIIFGVGALIVTGGIGFVVIQDVRDWILWILLKRKGRRPQLTTHTKLVFTLTAILLTAGFVLLLIAGRGESMQALSPGERLMAAFFQSVTPRTAGFNTIPLGVGSITGATAFLLVLLMFIGGSPGGTAGGIKTTTLGVMIASSIATLRGRDNAEMFHHSVRTETVHRVSSIVLFSTVVLTGGIMLLLLTESGCGFLEVVFEATSAFGTVGLSLGITDELSIPGRLIITVLMYIGRLGPVTVAMGMASRSPKVPYSYPPTNIMVG